MHRNVNMNFLEWNNQGKVDMLLNSVNLKGPKENIKLFNS